MQEHTFRGRVANTKFLPAFYFGFLFLSAGLVRSACGNLSLMGKKTPGLMCAFVAACMTTNRFSVPGATSPAPRPHCRRNCNTPSVSDCCSVAVAVTKHWPDGPFVTPTSHLRLVAVPAEKSNLFLNFCCCNSAPVIFFLPSRLFLNLISL